jgi:putative cell wall-binding protein
MRFVIARVRAAAVLATLAVVATLLVGTAAPAAASASGFVYAGLYTGAIDVVGDENTLAADYDALERWAGQRPTFGGAFVGITDAAATRLKLERVWRSRSTPFLNIEIPARAADIAAGQFDEQLRAWAVGIKRWFDQGEGRSAILAPLQEMNGAWTRWGCDPDGFKRAYTRIRSIVIQAGLDDTRVRWAFAPNGYSDRDCGPYTMGSYYPGAGIVDVIGFSAYNFGSHTWNGQPESPQHIYGPWLSELRSFAPEKPYLVAQTGTSPEAGRDEWLREAFNLLAGDPNVVGFLYFNLDKSAWGGGEWDWRIWYGQDGAPGLRDGLQKLTTVYAFPLVSWFRAGQPIPLTPDDIASGPVSRIAGGGRVATAVELSRVTRQTAEVVLLARADQYPDALAGGPLAHRLNAPLLLTGSNALAAETAAEIGRLQARRVVILGGAGAVSEAVAEDLRARGLVVERIAGQNRFETARLVAQQVAAGRQASSAAYFVEGANADPRRGWPDAVAVGSLAAFQGRPILLVTRDGLPTPTAQAIADLGVTEGTVVGGTAAVSETVRAAIAQHGVAVDRIAADTRYNTSRAVADRAAAAGMKPSVTWLATGRNYPDALAAAPAVAASGGVLLLVDGQDLAGSPAAQDWLFGHRPFEAVRLIGGTGVVSTTVETQARRLSAP